jgi:hypothetical protein
MTVKYVRALRPAVGSDYRAQRSPGDDRTVLLTIPSQADWCMEITYAIRAPSGGEPVENVIHNTLHHLGDR